MASSSLSAPECRPHTLAAALPHLLSASASSVHPQLLNADPSGSLLRKNSFLKKYLCGCVGSSLLHGLSLAVASRGYSLVGM